MGKRQRIVLDRRSFLQLSGASLAACGLNFALRGLAHAEIADPTGENLGSFTIDDLIERTDDPEIEKYASTGTLSLWIAGAFAASLSRMPNLPTNITDFVRSPTVISQSIWSRLPEPILHAGPIHIVDDWIYRQIWLKLPPTRRAYYHVAGGVPYRTLQEAFNVYKTIPLRIVMGGEEALSKFHQNKHWSHIIPSSKGGSNLASNGIFENALENMRRGDGPMTKAEFDRAQLALIREAEQVRLDHLSRVEERLAKSQITSLRKGLSSPALTRTLTSAARSFLPGAVAFALVEVAVVALEEGLRYHDGEIDRSDLFSRVAARVGKDALFAVVALGIVLGLVMVVPALGALLTTLAPVLVVMPFLLYGSRFYNLSAEWLQRIGFVPVIAAWNETKEIPKQAWAQAASSFESFQKAARDASEKALKSAGDASERAWQGIGGFSEDALHGIGDYSDGVWQGLGGAPRSAIQGTRGIAVRTWQGVEFFPNGNLESIGDFSAGAWQGAGNATQNAVQVTTETTNVAWEWVTVTSDGIAVDVTGVPEHVLDWLRDTFLPWLGDRVSPAVFWK